MHKSSATCVTAKHTPVTNQAPESKPKRKNILTIWGSSYIQ